MRTKYLAGLGVVLTSVLALTLSAPGPAANATERSATPRAGVVHVAEQLDVVTVDRMPLVESGTVRELPIDAGGVVALPGVPDGSALVRISVFRPNQAVSVTATGRTVLESETGRDASTTVLVPVRDGGTTIAASVAVNARVEVLAHFGADTETPGATVALPAVVNRVDSAAGTGIDALGSEPQPVSVVGVGGVPSTDVRAVHVTAAVELPSPGTVAISGQEMNLPAGRSVVTTIAAVDAEGNVTLSSSAGGHLSLDIRGWVAGATQDMSAANAFGSYVPSEVALWSEARVGAEGTSSLVVPGVKDRAMSVALVSAAASGSGHRSFLNVGDSPAGRSRGVLVDPQQGALPQIELVEAATPDTEVFSRGAAVQARVMPLGDIVGARSATAGRVDVTLQAPEQADLAESGTLELSGTVRSEAPVDRVELFGNGEHIGTAAVEYSDAGAHWRLITSAPAGGEIEFRAQAFARDGGTGDARGVTQVMMPDAEDIVVNVRTVVVDPKQITGVEPGLVSFASDPQLTPGDIMVAGVSEHTPDGALLRIVATQRTADGWTVRTEQAALTDAFVQAEHRGEYSAFPEGTELLPPKSSDDDTDIIDDGVDNVALVPADDVVPAAPAAAMARGGVAPAAAAPRLGVEVSKELVLTGTAKLTVPFTGKGKTTDVSRANSAQQSQAKKKVKLEGGLAFDAEVRASLGVVMVLDIQVDWNWGIPDPSLTYFKSAFTGGYAYNYKAQISGSAKSAFTKELANLRSAPITIPVGVVPVVLVPGATVTLAGEANGEYSVSFADSVEKSFEYGAEYRNGTWRPVDEVSPDTPANAESQCLGWGQQVTASGELDGKITLAIAGNVKIYGILGPEVTANAGVKAGMAAKLSGADGTFTMSSKRALLLGAALGINAKMKVLGFTIGDTWSHTVADVRIPLWETDDVVIPLCPVEDDGEDGEDGDSDLVLLHGTVSSASTTEPIPGAKITVTDSAGTQHDAMTDGTGEYEIEAAAGALSVVVEAEGYIPFTRTVEAGAGEQRLLNVRMSTRLDATQYRAVLTWGEHPRDLDSHLVGLDSSGSYHVYYSAKNARSSETGELIAQLDVDDVTGFGPETTTFAVQPDGEYAFFVHNYTGDHGEARLSTSGANVVLYRGSEKVGEYDVPSTGEGRYWNVFSIRGGEVIVSNGISDTPIAAGGSDTSQESLSGPATSSRTGAPAPLAGAPDLREEVREATESGTK